MDFDYLVIFYYQFLYDSIHFEALMQLLLLFRCFDFLFDLVTINFYFLISLQLGNYLFFLSHDHQIKVSFNYSFNQILIVLIHQIVVN